MIGFNSGEYDLNMVEEYFAKRFCCNREDECSEDVFAAKQEYNYMFLTTPKFKIFRRQNLHWTCFKLWCVVQVNGL